MQAGRPAYSMLPPPTYSNFETRSRLTLSSPPLAAQIMETERASVAAGAQGPRLLAVLGHIANAEIRCRGGLPEPLEKQLLAATLHDLRGIHADSDAFFHTAGDAERHQAAAGLDSRLSAAELHRLALLLHFRCTRHANRSPPLLGMAVPQLQQEEGGISEQLIALEGSGPMRPCFLRRRGLNLSERLHNSQGLPLFGQALQPDAAAAAYEASLAACESSRGEGMRQPGCQANVGRGCLIPGSKSHLGLCPFMPAASYVESIAALNLVLELMTGSRGPRWSPARVHSLLDQARRALARCKPWLPTIIYTSHKDDAAGIASKAAACAAAHLGAGDSLPAMSPIEFCKALTNAEVTIPACAVCGKCSLQLMKCSSCRAVAYW